MKRWPNKSIGELTSIVTKGTTPQTLGRQYTAEGIPFLRAENLQGGQVILDSDTLRINSETHNLLARSVIRPNDVLLSIAGTIGRAAIVSKDAPEMNCNQAVAIIRLNLGQITPTFLLLWLKSSNAQAQILGAQVTQTISNLSLGCIKQLQIPVPPLAEQERIVKLLDEADGLRKLRAQADHRTAQLLPALFHEMFGDPISNPRKWPKTTLAEACQKLTDGTHFSPPPAVSGIPYITAKHLREYGLDFDRNPTYVSLEHHREIYARCDPKPGDVLYIKDGATTGIAAVNRYDFEFSMLSSLALMRPNPAKTESEFLCAWLNDKSVKSMMLEQVAGAAITRLTLVKLKRASILLPPMPLQKEFAQRLKEIRALAAAQAASRRRTEDLFQSMLHKAFNGEL